MADHLTPFQRRLISAPRATAGNDPFVDHALREACTYLCDVIVHLNLRYSPKVANDVIRMLKLRMSEDQERWESYTSSTAPRVVAETKQMLGIECA